jgi:hypothetical protein
MTVSRFSLKASPLARVKQAPPEQLVPENQKCNFYGILSFLYSKEKEGKISAGEKICWNLEKEVLLQTLTLNKNMTLIT